MNKYLEQGDLIDTACLNSGSIKPPITNMKKNHKRNKNNKSLSQINFLNSHNMAQLYQLMSTLAELITSRQA